MENSRVKLVKKSAQEVQDKIFGRMSASKKFNLTFSISNLIIKINSIAKDKVERRYLAWWAIDELAQFADEKLTQAEENDLNLLKKYVK